MTKDLAYSFGTWMRHRRKTLDLTQPELAERLHCSVNTIKKLETNARRPSKQLAELLAVQFHIPEEQRTLFVEYARGDWRSVPAEIKEDPPWHVSPKSPRSNLPATVTSLIGREKEIVDVCEYLRSADVRLVTLIGPPGIGKTRLSIDVARAVLPDFPDGVFFIALAPLNNPTLITATIIQALGYAKTKNLDADQRLIEGIGGKRMLLVLDNCEHLIEDVAPLASGLLSACPRLKILTTSREALRVPGEWLYSVPTLEMPKENSIVGLENISSFPALILFAERARAARSDFELNAGNIQAVISICAQLDGLPLAIELIAARMRLMSPVAFLEHWNPQFVLSADGVRAVSTRQKTLHNAIAWSYNLLSKQEQILFARLSVFIGGFAPEAAKAVVAGGDISQSQVMDLLAQLINKSLVTVVANTVGKDVETRYGMLETIREYARGKLDDSAETDRLRQRHRDFFISFAELAERKLKSAEQFKWLDRLELEYDNLRGAWHCAIEGDPELALRLASALLDFWYACGNPGEGREWMSKLIPQTNHWGQTAMRAQAFSTAGYLAYLQDDFGSARSLLEEARKIVQVVKDKKVTAFVLLWIGRVAYLQREDQTAYTFTEECLTIYQELQDDWGIAMATYHLAGFDAVQGHHQEAEEQFRKSLTTFQDLGDKLSAGHVLNGLGELARLKGDYERAGKFYEESIELYRQQRSRLAGALPLLNLAWVSLHKGDHSRAKVLFNEVFKLFKENGNQFGVEICLLGFAGVLAVTGKPEMAAWLFGALESSYESMELQERKEFDHYVSVVRGRLDEATFAKVWAKGQAVTLEQAIVYALELAASL